MAKKNSDKCTADNTAVQAVDRQRIGVMMGKFIQTSSYGPHVHDKSFRSWNVGQVIYKQADIDDLISLNAPMKVFVEDVDGRAKG